MKTFLHNRLYISIAFLGTAALSALVYWFLWSWHPDHFVVAEHVNLHPIASVEDFLWGDGALPRAMDSQGMTALATQARELLERASGLRSQEQAVRTRIAGLEATAKKQSDGLNLTRNQRIEDYTRGELGPLEAEKARLVELVSDLRIQLQTDRTHYDRLRSKIAELELDLSRTEARLAQRRFEVADHVVKNLASFAKPEDLTAWLATRAEITKANDESLDTFRKQSELRGQALTLVSAWTKEQQARLGIVDFMYFSLGVTTTTTFGDIVPNHWGPRLIVSLQLLVSLVLVGLFVNSLAEK